MTENITYWKTELYIVYYLLLVDTLTCTAAGQTNLDNKKWTSYSTQLLTLDLLLKNNDRVAQLPSTA